MSSVERAKAEDLQLLEKKDDTYVQGREDGELVTLD